jgi:hypothetical protein
VSAVDEKSNPIPATPPITNIYRFDETGVNNQGLLNQWGSNASLFAMAGNQVLVNGQAAQFDPPSLTWLALQNAAAQFAKSLTADAFSQVEDAQLRALVFLLARNAGLL